MSVGRYFKDIFDTVHGVFVGMKITLRYAFMKPVTVNYPEQRLSFAPRYRGIHEFEQNKCIACDLCAKACPVDCIYIEKTAPRRVDKVSGLVDESDPKNGKMLRFAIDYSKCLFCALCTEPCPTECIHMGKLHDLSGYSRGEAVVEFTELDKVGQHTPVPLWMERNKDSIEWVGKEYERVKAGVLAGSGGDIPKV